MSSLPRPEPWTEERSPRLPPPPAISTGRELDLDLDQSDAPPPALLLRYWSLITIITSWGAHAIWYNSTLSCPPPWMSVNLTTYYFIFKLQQPLILLSNHLVRWWGVRKAWKQAALENEKRSLFPMRVQCKIFRCSFFDVSVNAMSFIQCISIQWTKCSWTHVLFRYSGSMTVIKEMFDKWI